MEYSELICKRCLYPSTHPLHITFDANGVCSGCRVFDEKNELDWAARLQELQALCRDYKSHFGGYDCVVPVSGGRDSFFIVHVVRNVLKLRPLLVNYNTHFNTSVGVRNLARLREVFDCDIFINTVSPSVVKKVTKATLRRFGSVYWHCIAGQTAFAVQTAVRFKIPLIVWGAHQGLEQVGMFSHLNNVEMTRKYRLEHDLMGHDAEDLVDRSDNLSEADVAQYSYPPDERLIGVGVRGIYLGNFVRWDRKTQTRDMISKYGYETRLWSSTYDNFSNPDCWVYSGVHDYLKLLKHGYRKVLDHACRDVRLGHLKRDEAIRIVDHFTSLDVADLDKFCDWLGITQSAFHFLAGLHRNPRFWKRNDNDCWELISPVGRYGSFLDSGEGATAHYLKSDKGCSSDPGDKYIILGRGK